MTVMINFLPYTEHRKCALFLTQLTRLLIYFQTQGLLLSDQSILSSFLPLIKASAADFQRFANGLTAAQHLRNLENELQSMIALLRRLQAIFKIVSWTNKMLITKVVVEVYD